MLIDGSKIIYNFGPQGSMTIGIAQELKQDRGWSDDITRDWGHWLKLQLACHAVHQIQCGGRGKLLVQKLEETAEWEPMNPEDPLSALVKVIRPLTHAVFNVIYDGNPVFSLQEASDCDYIVKAFNDVDDTWIDILCEYADEHCNCFGRI